jgi:hypothetical protein
MSWQKARRWKRFCGSSTSSGDLKFSHGLSLEATPAQDAGLRGAQGRASLREAPAQKMLGGRSRKYIGIQSNWTDGGRPRLRGATGAAQARECQLESDRGPIGQGSNDASAMGS